MPGGVLLVEELFQHSFDASQPDLAARTDLEIQVASNCHKRAITGSDD